jgi:MinD-like ATPase involved in chromosome partitioning or flagellar assembly
MALPVLVAVAGAGWESTLVAALDSQPGAVRVVRRCVDVADLLAAASTGQARVALLSAHLIGLDVEVVDRLLRAGLQAVGVVTPGSSAEADQLRRVGVADRIDVDAIDHIGALLDGIAPPPAAAPDGTRPATPPLTAEPGSAGASRGRVFAVWGPSGAPGRSTVALTLAGELAALGGSTLLVDADVYGGSVAQMLAILDESSGLLAAARAANTGRLDAQTLGLHARRVTPALRVLTGLPRADRWLQLRPAALASVLDAARSLAAFTVVDLSSCLEQDEELSFDTAAPRRNGATLLALEQADEVIAVGAADPVGLARLTRGLVELTEAVPGVTVRVLVNRMRPSLGWTESEVGATVTRFTGYRRISFLPADPDACDRALVQGRLLCESAPDARLRRAVRGLAVDLMGADAAARSPSGVRRAPGRLRRRTLGSSRAAGS